jgi:hypothetical protein
MRFSVHVPSDSYENSSYVEEADAIAYAYMMSQDYAYAEVRQGDELIQSFYYGR